MSSVYTHIINVLGGDKYGSPNVHCLKPARGKTPPPHHHPKILLRRVMSTLYSSYTQWVVATLCPHYSKQGWVSWDPNQNPGDIKHSTAITLDNQYVTLAYKGLANTAFLPPMEAESSLNNTPPGADVEGKLLGSRTVRMEVDRKWCAFHYHTKTPGTWDATAAYTLQMQDHLPRQAGLSVRNSASYVKDLTTTYYDNKGVNICNILNIY